MEICPAVCIPTWSPAADLTMAFKTLTAIVFAGLAIAVAGKDAETCSEHASTVTAIHAERYAHDDFTLTYFNGRGLGEIPRTIFATAGLFPGNGYSDVRLEQDEFENMRGTGDLAKNLNRVPVLNHNGFVIGQSTAISRYLGRYFGLYGRNYQEAAEIDAMMAHVDDVKAGYRKLFPYRVDLTDEEKEANYKIWFDTPSEPAIEGRKERQLQWFLEKIESILPGDGYSVGGRPSIADAYWFNLLLEQAKEIEGSKGEGWFGHREGTDRVLAMYPKLKQVVETFRDSPGMAHWLSTRVVDTW